LLWLVRRALTAFLADADENGDFKRWYFLTREDVPDEYIPQQDSYFDPYLRPPGAETLRQQILIEGHWTLDEIARYPRWFEEVYAAQALLSKEPDSRVRSDIPFGYSFKSGYVYHNFWQVLHRWVFRADRDYKVQYASPGIIEIGLEERTANSVVRSVRDFEANYKEIHDSYKAIHTWVKAQKKELAAGSQLVGTAELRSQLLAMCEQLGSISYEQIDAYTRQNVLNTAEVVLSYYRRLKSLADYEMKGRATLVAADPGIPLPVRDDDAHEAEDIDSE
jgi:hypothetical protein